MIRKELKKLRRRELIDIIYQMKKTEESLQEEIASLQEQLQDKRIRLSVAGSISEAAVSITNVFSTAQMTADLYLSEIASMKEDTARECANLLNDANKKAASILAKGEQEYKLLNDRCQDEHKKLLELRAQIQKLENPEQHKG